MVYYARWKIILVLCVVVLSALYAAPNLIPQDKLDKWAQGLPSWMPLHKISLGLDLQGGSHLLLGVEVKAVVNEYLDGVADSARSDLRKADIGYSNLATKDGVLSFDVRDEAQAAAARDAVASIDQNLVVTLDGATVSAQLSEKAYKDRATSAVAQSIEIIRRRIDESGTREPLIQQQGIDRVLVQLPGVGNPEHIKRLLGQTAKLGFHLVNETANPRGGSVPAGFRVMPAAPNNLKGPPLYVVSRRPVVSGDTLTDAQPSFDQQSGRPVVNFKFDSIGARRFGDVTRDNIGHQLAIVLDDKVVSAPVIQSAITGGSGVISGSFSVQEANDLALLLRAGALPAPLTVLEERTVGPGLGADSIAAGEIASGIGLAVVVVFMVLSYGRFGVYANIALVANIVMLLAALSLLGATLTLPGIAGIVLTMGMAVDANVLIFERIREEYKGGRGVVGSIDAGFNRAIGTITDSNLTTLIAAALLYGLGSGSVRGFAVTLAIGILTSMFSAIMITRLVIVFWVRSARPKIINL
ncbi:protein translocase subunit SecD [Radicibacter daui]|uniref:protein translocase subunit SecD n=1 Tax=Radicibacter daui TaxID=3064829 RepID=UPI004046F848